MKLKIGVEINEDVLVFTCPKFFGYIGAILDSLRKSLERHIAVKKS
jgi:hypothetical protein